jgi:copper chaperone CopZ
MTYSFLKQMTSRALHIHVFYGGNFIKHWIWQQGRYSFKRDILVFLFDKAKASKGWDMPLVENLLRDFISLASEQFFTFLLAFFCAGMTVVFLLRKVVSLGSGQGNVKPVVKRTPRKKHSSYVYAVKASPCTNEESPVQPATVTPKTIIESEDIDKMAKATIQVNGMTCNHCKKTVESNLLEIEGIETVKADLDTGHVALAGSRIDLDEVRKVIDDLGYEYGGQV